ncbi:MAG: hypothetical protein QW511_05895 [Candidatus Methanomethylicia archaeon]
MFNDSHYISSREILLLISEALEEKVWLDASLFRELVFIHVELEIPYMII